MNPSNLSEQAITDADLDAVELRYTFRFPLEMREFYRSTNGARPLANRFVDANGTRVLHEILPIKYGQPSLTLEATLRRLRMLPDFLPDFLIPFAVDPGGAYFCFSTRQIDSGSIFLFVPDFRERSNGGVEFLSHPFHEFIASLVTKDEAKLLAQRHQKP